MSHRLGNVLCRAPRGLTAQLDRGNRKAHRDKRPLARRADLLRAAADEQFWRSAPV